uniref:Uncharacterized protein n=1 Tax=Amphimedon queenslandica TaxID=400682 RepID=A0A1X7TKB0_AMPQE
MSLVKCKICGRQEGQSEWFKSAQLIDKCGICKEEDEAASKLKHERELEKIEKSFATRKDEVTHKKNAEIEIIDCRGEKAEAVAKVNAEVELEKVKLLRESDERRCKIVQDMIQSGQVDDNLNKTVQSLLAPLTIQFRVTPVDSSLGAPDQVVSSTSLNEQETKSDDEPNIGDENIDD